MRINLCLAISEALYKQKSTWMLQARRQRWRKSSEIRRLRLRTKTTASQSVPMGAEVWVPLSSRERRDLGHLKAGSGSCFRKKSQWRMWEEGVRCDV